jgi:hypothetical protein
MKYFRFVFLSFLVFAFVSVSAQKQYLAGTEIPDKIQNYVKKHFPDATITSVKREVKPLKTKYEVKLMPKAEIEFDGDLNVKEVEAKAGIPNGVVPRKIENYLASNFPNVLITEWELKETGHKVKLINGTKLYFDLKENFVSGK